MSNSKDLINKADRNKIYFLVVVIAALLGTNAYLLTKGKDDGQQIARVQMEKDRLNVEVEKIEIELDKINTINLKLSEKLITEQNQARKKIAELKLALKETEIDARELESAQQEVKSLREFLRDYSTQIVRLHKENDALKSSMDSLKVSAGSDRRKVAALVRKNEELDNQLRSSAALKATNIEILAFKVKSNGKNVGVTKASTANKLSIHFGIISNQLARKDYHKIYLRVFDPAGNLIANENNMFESEGQEMQFSTATSISYNDDDTAFVIDWINPNAFIRGDYTVILYSDGFTMGRASIHLR